jgi:hypothetical protein
MPTWGWVLLGVGFAVVACLGVAVAGTLAGLTILGQRVNSTFSMIGSGLNGGVVEPAGLVAFQFYDYLNMQDYQSAHGLLGADMASRYTPQDLQNEWEALQSAHGPFRADFHEELEVNNSRATLVQPITSDSGQRFEVTLELEDRGDGTWQITGASPGLIPQP